MSGNLISGRAWVYGDNVDTDVIIPARYLTMSDPGELARHCLEDLDATFAQEVKPGDIVVAGANFGCGSSREHAPLALLGCGVGAVVAGSFARIFYRNALNVGFPILECAELSTITQKGDRLSIDLAKGIIVNESKGAKFTAPAFPGFLQELVAAGGLVAYGKRRLETP